MKILALYLAILLPGGAILIVMEQVFDLPVWFAFVCNAIFFCIVTYYFVSRELRNTNARAEWAKSPVEVKSGVIALGAMTVCACAEAIGSNIAGSSMHWGAVLGTGLGSYIGTWFTVSRLEKRANR
jgi:hypothetical protein